MVHSWRYPSFSSLYLLHSFSGSYDYVTHIRTVCGNSMAWHNDTNSMKLMKFCTAMVSFVAYLFGSCICIFINNFEIGVLICIRLSLNSSSMLSALNLNMFRVPVWQVDRRVSRQVEWQNERMIEEKMVCQSHNEILGSCSAQSGTIYFIQSTPRIFFSSDIQTPKGLHNCMQVFLTCLFFSIFVKT